MSQDIKTSDCHMSPQRKGKAMWSRKSKQRKSKELLIPRDGELMEERFEISLAKEDHSDGIDDRRGCAAGGAGGCIYYAKDLATGRDVAIKFYSPILRRGPDGEGDAKYTYRDPNYSDDLTNDFEKERRIVEELRSLPREESKYFPEYIAKGSYRSKRPYYVMEKLQALTPAQCADEKACEKIILEVCRAAQILSNHGMIALDIKPDNIMFRPADKHFVLVDMGLVADKDAYQKVSREMLEKYSRLSLSARCGTVGFFSELYSPHHEARMIYAIGGLIESLFGERMLPEWQEIVFRCRRLNEQHCFESIDMLIRRIRVRKSLKRLITRETFARQSEVELRKRIEMSNSNLTRLLPWHIAILDPRLRRKGFCEKMQQTEDENQLTFPGLDNKWQVQDPGWCETPDRVIEIAHGPIEHNARKGVMEAPIVIRMGATLCHEVEWKIREKVRVVGHVTIVIAGPGVINIDFVGSSKTTVFLNEGVTLINRTQHIDEDQSTYHLGNFSYINFKNGVEDNRQEYKMKVFQSLYGPSFVRYNGPKSLGVLVATQSRAVEQSLEGGFPVSRFFVKTMCT